VCAIGMCKGSVLGREQDIEEEEDNVASDLHLLTGGERVQWSVRLK
jgi:hypothetical protein